jgi:dihydrofolate reductase
MSQWQERENADGTFTASEWLNPALPPFVRTRRPDMRRVKIIEHISLDGVIQNSIDDDDFPYSDWSGPYRSAAGLDAILAAYGDSFDVLLGRRTYDGWSSYWPTAPSSPMADRLSAATKYVATHRPQSLEWGPFEGLGPDVVEGIRRIKSHDGTDLVLSGSSTLTSIVLEHGLADELVLAVSPVLLGTGKRLLAQGTPARAFELVGTTAMPTGIILSTYEFAGPLMTG